MVSPDVIPAFAHANGATVLTFPAHADDFACMNAAKRYLQDRGFSVGAPQADAPAGILFGDVRIAKWRNLTAVERSQLHGRIEAPGRTGRTGPVTITIYTGAPRAAHFDILLPEPRPRRSPRSLSDRSADIAIAGMFACIAGLGLLAFLPRPAPASKHGADVGQLFRAPKIGLRAEALKQRLTGEEVQR